MDSVDELKDRAVKILAEKIEEANTAYCQYKEGG